MPKKKEAKPKADKVAPEVLTSVETEEQPIPEPKKLESAPEPPKPKPEQTKAAAYLAELKFTPEPLPEREPDTRAGKRPPPPNQPEPRLSARQFVRARKHRWERSAGFLLEMKRRIGPNARLTLIEWQPLWDAFWTRPIGGCRR